ncbi:hypothetical protein PV371_32860 [Streptomyces sp. TX20-6-3]|uniref:hypothetical protein n=1 Tax=Streptomyces sp. TX20-6-3 TaxID=3028705 RepID=UPI0029B9A2CD|nr:hypothetical protein [Streptomyces sp. TX20-6-3]MDX2564418.1 hypothetical protein [Streptomyces sp. TX20-6-3]
MNEPTENKGPKVPPSYPPRTPPPQKKPVELPRPEPKTTPGTTALPLPGPRQARVETRRPRMAVRNRRVSNWVFPADSWAAGKAVRNVTRTVRGWEYSHPRDSLLEECVRLLVDAAVRDAGRRVSVHLADQDGLVLVVVLSHTEAEPDQTVLTSLAAVTGTVSCGADASDEGRRIWSLLSTEPPRTRTPAA